MFSHFFIRRPIFAIVIAVVILMVGGAALLALPVARYPEITPPTITVTANYPGADAQTVANAIAAPIETQVNGVDRMIYMQSTSTSTGSYTLTVSFQTGTDPDTAQVQVQNRLALATPQLPDVVQRTGVQVQKRSSSFLILIAVYSPDGRYDSEFVSNYATLYVLDAIKRVPGANQASAFASDQAMRLWLRPDRMAALGITAGDVQTAVAAQNAQFSAGAIGQPPTDKPVELTYPVVTQGRFSDPREFENIILRADPKGVATVLFKDIGRAEVGSQNYLQRTHFNGKPTAVIAVYQQAGSNALQVAKGVRKALEGAKKAFPAGLDYAVALDTTDFVKISIKEVIQTLIEAIVLVVLVVYIFLQHFRATLIPTLAVVVSVIGTFAGLYLLGFTINLLTLFALVLAVGIVVDDAIVVIENVERNIRTHHLSARDAAFRAMEEVTGPVIAIVLVLAAVFVPTAFIGGTTGQLYRQFAITIVVSVSISGLIALTLTPALAAILLKPSDKPPAKFFQRFNHWFERLTDHYVHGVDLLLKHGLIALVFFGAMVIGVWLLFRHIPSSFIPSEDQGYLINAALLPDAASLDRTEAVTDRVEEELGKDPAVKNRISIAGFSILDGAAKSNGGSVFVTLDDFEKRKKKNLSSEAVVSRAKETFSHMRESMLIPITPPAIPGLGTQGGFEFWLQNRGSGSPEQLQQTLQTFMAKAAQRPELTGLNTTFTSASRQLHLDVDRARAETLGVPVQDVYSTLQTLFGSLYVSQFNQYSRVWQVILQAEPEYRRAPTDIQNIYVRGRDAQMVPLSSIVSYRFSSGPQSLPRFNAFAAASIRGQAAPGYSSGQALDAMEEVAQQTLSEDYGFAWAGLAYEERQAGFASTLVFVIGIVMVFLILAAQYNAWGLPLSVISAVPFGVFGALVAVWLRGIENDIYFQIGLVTLIGLAAKNAILIVEFAVIKRESGMSIEESALEAARLRLRPIMMTSLAFILGALPLAIASGAGANSRHAIGTGIIGGMVAATTLALFFVPLFYVRIESARERLFPAAREAATHSRSEGTDEHDSTGHDAAQKDI